MEKDDNYAGIIPRTIFELFNLINENNNNEFMEKVVVFVSFLEIYNEKIYDLLGVFIHKNFIFLIFL